MSKFSFNVRVALRGKKMSHEEMPSVVFGSKLVYCNRALVRHSENAGFSFVS